ncbi:TPA: UvrD-helicase domain-containing protein [Streptococcus suis]|nr:UvrD-helicase domain-containing protein [Streptococcus suis]
MTTIDFKKVYEEEFLKLNAKQKEAVETVEGPVMVIAGPGTGKTQILSRRVANILLNYDTNPEEIVCLTYTEAGATEMLDRLENLLGERGRNVRVSTIHAFCSAIILANPDYFENQPKIISTAVQFEILKEVMDEYIQEGDALYKNSGDRYSSKDQLLDLLSRMKRQLLEKADIKGEVDEYLKTIEFAAPGDELYKKFRYARKTTNKNTGVVYQAGDLKPDFEKEQSKFDKVINGAEIIEKYRERLSAQNYFDFDDMILWTKGLLEQNPKLQQTVADGIKYLFVDEFQDTSVIQNELVDLLVAGKDKPNIFVVGDDDQSIYRFQGVSATNIEDFGNKYHPVEIILEENYRSSQAIIDAAKQLISHNPRREKHLHAAGKNKDYAPKPPTLTKYETEYSEMVGVLNGVKELIDNDVTPSEIGIIYGRNAYGKKLAKLFRENGIPVYIKIEEVLFDDPFFKKLHAVLQYLSGTNRNLRELRKLLYFDFFNVSITDLIEMRNAQNIEDVKSDTVIKLDKEIEKLRHKILNSKQYHSPMYVLQQIVKTFEIDTYIMQSPEKYHLVSVLTALYELMLNEVFIKSELSLTDFLDCIVGLKAMKIEIPINEIETSPENCVNLMTAHGSKGLEFDYVFMVKCNDGKRGVKWPGGENNSGSFSYPPNLNGKEDNESELKLQEERRLFYVAMTRAKKELRLTYNGENDKTHFIDEFHGHYKENSSNEEFAELSNQSVRAPSLAEETLKEVVADFSLSVSTLNSFLKCPLSFYFNKVLRLPSEGNEAMTFGSIVHETLEGIYVSDKDDSQELTSKSILPKDEIVKRFEEIFERESWKLPTERARKDDYARGLSIIDNFYNAADYLKPGKVAVEKNIQDIKFGDIKNTTVDLSEVADFTINGKIDKIEIDGDIIRVIDYKTGSAKNAAKKLEVPGDKSLEGEDYWRQAVFYYILVTNSDIDLFDKQVRVQYVFVEDETDPKGFSFTPDIEISEEDINVVLEQIKGALLQIQSGNFTCGCGIFEEKKKANGLTIYPCDYCVQATLNAGPLLDNSRAIEVASYQQAVKSFKSLSVSTLNRFLNCSNSFYFDNVLKLTGVAGLKPAAKEYVSKVEVNHAPTGPVFGTVMHETMEKIYKENLQTDGAIAAFDKSLFIHEAENIDTMSTKEMKECGHKLIKNLFESYIPDSCKDVKLEEEIHVTLADNLPINGIIDKLEFDGDTVRVVDYKTGSAQRGIEELAVGGNYWRQAVYYNILLEESPNIDTGGKTIETRYIFLDDDSQETGYSIHDVEVALDDITTVKQQIQAFWQQVRTFDFTGHCGKEDCDFCKLGEYVDFKQLKN